MLSVHAPCPAAEALPSQCTQSALTVTCTYTGAGTYPFTVPGNVTSLKVAAVGAAGGSASKSFQLGAAGGRGASVQDTAIPVTSGTSLSVIVGGVGGDGTGTGTARHGGAGGTPGGGAPGGDAAGRAGAMTRAAEGAASLGCSAAQALPK